VRSERLFLAEAKRVLTEGFSLDERLDQLARGRMPKRVLPGSREWDVLYRRYYEEERRKRAVTPAHLLDSGSAVVSVGARIPPPFRPRKEPSA